VAAAVLAIGCAACGGSSGGSSGGGSASGGGASATATFPVTVDAANGKVHLASKPHAIISLSPTATEMLYAIGAGGQVKAVDSDSDYPAQAPKTNLSAYEPNVEAIASYKPDLVVLSNNIDGIAKKLAALSVPVLLLPAASTVSDVYTEFSELGEATGHLPQAQHEDTAIRAQLSKIVAAAPKHARPLTYYYELDQTYYSVTSDTFVGKLLGLFGMKSIADSAKGAAAAGGYPQLSAEFIVKANPDYIILADTICCHQSAATVAHRPGWSSLTAVRDKHIIGLNDDIASRWGPRIVDLLRTVEQAIAAGQTS
jgi:iron complex transport system substrate-binding protein